MTAADVIIADSTIMLMRSYVSAALLCYLSSMPLCVGAQGLDALIERLDTVTGYSAAIRYSVTLPQAEDDVVYDVGIDQPDSGSYLIQWSVDTPSGVNEGFSAWIGDGHFYNYRNHRLREYHTEWDSVPLTGDRAVQHTVQFAQLRPAGIARELRAMAADTARFRISMVSPDELSVIRMANGMPDAEMRWLFDPAMGMPVEFSAEYNPGALAEQLVRAVYAPCAPTVTVSLSEKWLINRYPEVFENCRQSNFAIESMPGQQLPSFSLPLTFGDSRLSHQSGAELGFPVTVIVLLDADAALTPRLVDEIRSASARVPVENQVIYAFAGRDPEVNRAALGGRLLPGESAVNGARRLAADCGAASLPVVMVCDRHAVVRNVTVGLNNQLAADVMKMITLSTTSSSSPN